MCPHLSPPPTQDSDHMRILTDSGHHERPTKANIIEGFKAGGGGAYPS